MPDEGAEPQDRTQDMEPPAPPEAPAAAPAQTGEDADRRLARQLAARGVAPDEIERLLSLGRKEDAPQPVATPVPIVPPLSVLEDEPFVPHPTISLPDIREVTADEKVEADRLLARASLAFRRGDLDEALATCRQALEANPGDAGAAELCGDVLQALGRVDDALYCYEHATQVEPGRRSAEKRYAELRLLQERGIAKLLDENLPRNATVAVLMSALLPGAGQLYNGEPIKGLCIAVAALICVLVLGWSPWGFRHGLTSVTASVAIFLLAAAAVYVYGVVDASAGATRGVRSRHKTGWEV